MKNEGLSKSCAQNQQLLNRLLRIEESFDLVAKPLEIGGRPAVLYFVDGFAKDEVFEKILEHWMTASQAEIDAIQTPAEFMASYVPYVETTSEVQLPAIVTAVLSGTLCLILEGFAEAFLVDARTYPSRSVSEPEDSKVLRGSRDGFVETLIFNTALIRRRMRDPQLTMSIVQVGTKSKTDVVFCYMDQLVDQKILANLKKKVSQIQVNTLTLSQESLAECIAKMPWYNPFPKIKYTERPDLATANLAEGKIIILVDNSPAAMILPTSFFDFVQDTNDFYFPPLVGTYLRLVRTLVFGLTIFLTPLWLLFMQNPDYLPDALSFLKITDEYDVPLIVQLLIFEFVIDGLKLASLNTPSALSNSFSIIGALILGEFAVKTGWFLSDVVLYMSFVAIANFAQPSFELAYAFKLVRMLLLLLTAWLNLWGFLGGLVMLALLLATTQTVTGRSYLYPLIPFDASAMRNLMVRRKISKENTQ